MADPASPAAGSIVIPSYEVGELIGSGGFGEVYRARHTVIGRDVAIKVLRAKYSADPEAMARFVAEARAVGKLSHPGIVDLFELGTLPDGRQYFVMELIRGKTLRDVLHEKSPLPLTEALPLLRAIAEAIDAAHAAGIAHRDLKPDNVFVVDGGVKLIDFGLAKLTREDSAPVTETGSVFGTPLYMSPEQCRGKAVTLATDAYSFGVVAYQVLTGQPPFSGEAIELALHHLNDDPAPPSARVAELGDRVDRVVLALLAKDPAQRPMPIAPAIDAIVEGSLPRAPRVSRARWIWPAIALVAIAAAGVAVLLRTEISTGAADRCATPAQRLAGVWDGTRRAVIAFRYAIPLRDDVAAAGRVLTKELDTYADAWSSEWIGSCESGERTTDPLLYAQRINCFDNALLALRGVSEAATTMDPALFAGGYFGVSGLPSIADCKSTAFLRALPPLPPPQQREVVATDISEMQRARTALRTSVNTRRWDLFAAPMAQLVSVAKRLDALGVPAAAEAWYWRAHMLRAKPFEGASGLSELRDAIAFARKRAVALRSDAVLGRAQILEASLEIGIGADQATSERLIATAAETIERAGNPVGLVGDLEGLKAGLAMEAGDLDEAATHYRATSDAYRRAGAIAGPEQPVELLWRRFDFEGAIAVARSEYDQALEHWGPHHDRTLDMREQLWSAYYAHGEHQKALDTLRANLLEYEATGATGELFLAYPRVAESALLVGETGIADHCIDSLVQLKGPHPDPWASMLFDAINTGQYKLARRVLDRMPVPTEELEMLVEDARVALAWFERRFDVIRERTPHALALATKLDAPLSSTNFLVVANAALGDRAAAERGLAALERKARTPPVQDWEMPLPDGTSFLRRTNPLLARGYMMAELRRWADAIPPLAEARTMYTSIAFKGSDVADLDTTIGVALLETGNARGAIAKLTSALATIDRCCQGFSGFAPVAQFALARALWDTGGDKQRALAAAQRAAQGFVRLERMKERDAVETWLAAHHL